MKTDLRKTANNSNRGNFFLKQGKYEERFEEAINYFQENIKADPYNSDNYAGIGEVYFQQGQHNEAIKWFKVALRVNSNDCLIYDKIGASFIRLKKYEDALEWFQKGIEVNSGNMHYNYNYNPIVALYQSMKWYDEAIKYFNEIVKFDPRAEEILEAFKKRDGITKEIQGWIEADIKKIMELCREKKIKLILQSYPGKGGTIGASQILRSIAKKYSILFIDQFKIFEKSWDNEEDRNKYFGVLDGHCNAKGYELMARNIYNKIIAEKLLTLDGGI